MRKIRILFLLSACLLSFMPALFCAEALAAAPETLVAAVPFLTGTGTAAADEKYGKIFNVAITPGAASGTQLAVIAAPRIVQPRYAITGFIRYTEVTAPGYLEIWNRFPGGGAYFSRTLGGGVMAPIGGSSEWRRFVLPFYTDSAGGKMIPEQIELNLVLPQGGKVSFAKVELHQFTAAQDPLTFFSDGWWSPAQISSLSTAFTVLLVIWWVSISILAARGKSRSLVIGSLKVGAALGAAVLLFFLAAAASGQPFHVLLPAGIAAALLIAPALVHSRTLNARYDEIDRRRMLARDARL